MLVNCQNCVSYLHLSVASLEVGLICLSLLWQSRNQFEAFINCRHLRHYAGYRMAGCSFIEWVSILKGTEIHLKDLLCRQRLFRIGGYVNFLILAAFYKEMLLKVPTSLQVWDCLVDWHWHNRWRVSPFWPERLGTDCSDVHFISSQKPEFLMEKLKKWQSFRITHILVFLEFAS